MSKLTDDIEELFESLLRAGIKTVPGEQTLVEDPPGNATVKVRVHPTTPMKQVWTYVRLFLKEHDWKLEDYEAKKQVNGVQLALFVGPRPRPEPRKTADTAPPDSPTVQTPTPEATTIPGPGALPLA